MHGHADSREERIARMVDVHPFDYFFTRDLAELLPALHGHPGWEVRNGGDDFDGIPVAEREVPHTLVDENSLERVGFVGVQTCERQDTQEQSRGSKFADRRTLNSIESASPKFFNGRITKPICSALRRLA